MSALIRDAPFGQIVRYITNNRVFQYPEEQSDFQIPASYTARPDAKRLNSSTSSIPSTEPETSAVEEVVYPDPKTVLEKIDTHKEDDDTNDLEKLQTIRTEHTARTQISRVGTRAALSTSISHADLEQQFSQASVERGPSRPIAPETQDDGIILVDWYTTDDAENPQNWLFGRKLVVLLQLLMYTMGVYMGSAIYTPSISGVMERFGVEIGAASMGVSMYVLAYGVGPLLFSPLSEIPIIGRNPPYIVSYAIFIVLLVPTVLTDDFNTLIALRFLQGFFGSLCLATGGATLQDIYSLMQLPYRHCHELVLVALGDALVQWPHLPLSLFFFFPETSSANILLRLAQRLRKLTSNPNLKAQSEIDQANLTPRAIATEALWRPFELMLLDPSIAFTTVYTAITYGIFFSFFEAFPLVYIDVYHFNLGQMGLTFLSVIVAVTLSVACYWFYIYHTVNPSIIANGLGAPERCLIPALVVTFFVPIGLFIFGWTAREDVHWIVSCIGIGITTIGIFLIMQCVFLYLPLSYPQYAASLFAGNDFTRSALAAGSIHFSYPMFHNLGVDKGSTLLAGLTVGCSAGVYILYFFGEKLRAKSRFAAR